VSWNGSSAADPVSRRRGNFANSYCYSMNIIDNNSLHMQTRSSTPNAWSRTSALWVQHVADSTNQTQMPFKCTKMTHLMICSKSHVYKCNTTWHVSVWAAAWMGAATNAEGDVQPRPACPANIRSHRRMPWYHTLRDSVAGSSSVSVRHLRKYQLWISASRCTATSAAAKHARPNQQRMQG